MEWHSIIVESSLAEPDSHSGSLRLRAFHVRVWLHETKASFHVYIFPTLQFSDHLVWTFVKSFSWLNELIGVVRILEYDCIR